MLIKSIKFAYQPAALACDGQCSKAWGINVRERVQLSDDIDDYEYLSDSELGDAPRDPGTSEGGQSKPIDNGQRLNKWCARECERSVLVSERDGLTELRDLSRRLKNRAGSK